MRMDKDEAYKLGTALIEASTSKGTVQVIPMFNTVVAVPALNGYTVDGGIIIEDDSTSDGYEHADNLLRFTA